jgi:hypothetical protein
VIIHDARVDGSVCAKAFIDFRALMKAFPNYAGALLLLVCSGAAAPFPTMWIVPTGGCSTVLIRILLAKREGFIFVAQGFPGHDDELFDPIDATACDWAKWDVTNKDEVSCSPYEDGNKTLFVCEAVVNELVPQLTYFYGYNVRNRSPITLSSAVHTFEAPTCGLDKTVRSLLYSCGVQYNWIVNPTAEAKLFFFADVGRDAGGQNVAAAVYDAAHEVSKASCRPAMGDSRVRCVAGMPVAIVLGGDTAYANKNNAKKWDQFLNSVAPVLLSKAVVWVSPGNHDLLYGNEPGYTLRFAAPNLLTAGERTPCTIHPETAFIGRYYSLNIGKMHIVAVCNHCEVDRTSEQTHFINTDMLCYDKEQTPLLVGIVHEPWYTSSADHFYAGTPTRDAFEETFLEHGMNLMMSGHIHSMEVVARQPNDSGILHVTAGHGGREKSYEFLNALGNTTWTLARAIPGAGFSTVSVNADGAGQLDIFYFDEDEGAIATAYSQPLSSERQESASGTNIEDGVASPTSPASSSAAVSASPSASATSSYSSSATPSSSSSASATSSGTSSSSSSASASASPTEFIPVVSITPSKSRSHSKSKTASRTPPQSVSATISESCTASQQSGTGSSTALASVSSTNAAGAPVVSVPAQSGSSLPSTSVLSPSPSGSNTGSNALPPSLAVGETVPLVVGMFAVCILLAASFSWLRARRRAARRPIDITSAPAASSARAPADLEVTARDVDIALDSDDETARLNLAAAAVAPASSNRKVKAKQEDKSPKASSRKKQQSSSSSAKKQQDRSAGTHLMTADAPDDEEGWAWTEGDDHVELTSMKADNALASASRDVSRRQLQASAASSDVSAEMGARESRIREQVVATGGKKGMRLTSSRATAEKAKPTPSDAESITVRSFEPAPQGSGNGWNIDDDFDLQ